MKVLIAYGTTEGQTRKIAERLAEHLKERGHDVTVYDTDSLKPDLNVGSYDAVFVAASVHQERHQETVADFVIAHRDQLRNKPTAFISVSLSAAMHEMQEAQSYVDQFLSETGWQPTDTLLAAGALRYSEYDFFKQQVIKFIVMRKGGLDKITRDHEFTDWDAVYAFADTLLNKVQT